MLELILENKEIAKIIYGFILTIISIAIVLRTDYLFKISYHQGIRYFRNAFFFYGIAFIFRYLFFDLFISNPYPINYETIKFIFEFFLIMAGFFLLYSLIWKKFEDKEGYPSSLMNRSIIIFYAMTLILVLIDLVWKSYYSLFISQIIIFLIASIVAYKNYINLGRERKFLKFYFIAMVLSLATWSINALAAFYLSWNPIAIISIYFLNISVFFIILIGVFKFSNIK